MPDTKSDIREMRVEIVYRGPGEYDINFTDGLIDGFEVIDLLEYVTLDFRARLFAAGHINRQPEPLRIQ